MSYGVATFDANSKQLFSVDESVLTPLLSVAVPPNSSTSIDVLPYFYDISKLVASIVPLHTTSQIVRTISNPVFMIDERGFTVLSFTPASGTYAVYSLVMVLTKLK